MAQPQTIPGELPVGRNKVEASFRHFPGPGKHADLPFLPPGRTNAGNASLIPVYGLGLNDVGRNKGEASFRQLPSLGKHADLPFLLPSQTNAGNALLIPAYG